MRDFLAAPYGAVPEGLHVNCSGDTWWPVLVSFTSPRTGRVMVFSEWFLDSEVGSRFAQ